MALLSLIGMPSRGYVAWPATPWVKPNTLLSGNWLRGQLCLLSQMSKIYLLFANPVNFITFDKSGSDPRSYSSQNTRTPGISFVPKMSIGFPFQNVGVSNLSCTCPILCKMTEQRVKVYESMNKGFSYEAAKEHTPSKYALKSKVHCNIFNKKM